MIKKIFGLVLLAFLISCGSSSSNDSVIDFDTSKLEPLNNGFHYEGWAMINGDPISTGKFNVDTDGSYLEISDPIDLVDYTLATAIVLTIEPDGDTDLVPSDTKYLGGLVTDKKAEITTSFAGALNSDYSTAEGKYILATPTDTDSTNETSGVWFIDAESSSAGLNLPTLPSGWVYEGWVVIDGTPVSTGTFVDVIGSDDAAPFSGPVAGPNFPGEDFLLNAPAGLEFPLDLSENSVVVSIEPSPDDSTKPFALKPLTNEIPADAETKVVYDMENKSSEFPVVNVTIN